MPIPVVLIHGYSDRGASFEPWRRILVGQGYRPGDVRICSYRSLTNEVTIRDVAEGFDRALGLEAGLGGGQPFDAIVHSTGMLVIRAWLTQYAGRAGRLKHLIGLAPATWGSPLAHKGRSWLGAVFKGNPDMTDPDFLEAGDLVLDALELGSRFTWELADRDLFGAEPVYGPDGTTPWVFTLCGTETYRGFRAIANEPGTDGTVRWAGCALDSRKLLLDLTRDPARPGAQGRVRILGPRLDSPVALVGGVNHATILSEPDRGAGLVDLVLRALRVDKRAHFTAWQQAAAEASRAARARLTDEGQLWQQFVVRAVDERGDPVRDYHLQLVTHEDNPFREAAAIDTHVHAYRADPSFRCFHLNLARLRGVDQGRLRVRVIASSGSRLVAYSGHGSEKRLDGRVDEEGKWDAQLDLRKVLDDPRFRGFRVFHPFTTTLIELRLNREPLPLDPARAPFVCVFGTTPASTPAGPARPDPARLEAP